MGIRSILDLGCANPVVIRVRLFALLMGTVLELERTPCIPMEERIGRDHLIFSRTFSRPIIPHVAVRLVMNLYAQQASARPANHNLRTKVLATFAATSHYTPGDTRYPSCVPLPMPTVRSVLLARATFALPARTVQGVKYVWAGVKVPGQRHTGNQAVLEPFENRTRSATSASCSRTCPRSTNRGALGWAQAVSRTGRLQSLL